MKDEPDWMVDQMLQRKRKEIFQRWQEREDRLARLRAKEKETEGRSSKRRRLDDAGTKRERRRDVDEEAEFLLTAADEDGGDDDPMALFSKETRALMESMGLG